MLLERVVAMLLAEVEAMLLTGVVIVTRRLKADGQIASLGSFILMLK